MNSHWDVIVVGAGPGGSTAARTLAQAGLRVLILEKEKFPRYKPCGGGLTSKVRRALDLDFSPTVESTIRQASIAYGAERMRMEISEAWCVMRPQFDVLLAEHAASAGAGMRDAQPVTAVEADEQGVSVTTPSGEERGKFLVGADGVNGVVRRTLSWPAHQRMGVAIEAEMDVPSATMDEWQGVLHLDFSALPWGYGWIFPKAEHLSVGVGDLIRRGHATDLRAELARYVAAEPSLSQAKARLTRGHRVPLGGQFGRYDKGRVVLVGDAAGLVDPFTAEGIYYAIRSGRMAAEEICQALGRGDTHLERYSTRINREINADFRYAWALTQVFYRMSHLAYRIFRRSRTTRQAVAQVTDGALTYRQMLWRVATSLGR